MELLNIQEHEEEKDTIYSYSRLQTFNECEMNYFLTYIKGFRNEEGNIYTEIGKCVHSLEEDLLAQKITKEQALNAFLNKVDDCSFIGMEFATEKSGVKYIESIKRYFEDYERFDIKNYKTEEHFIADIDGIKVQGFIDLYYEDENGYVTVIDHKTSTKFAKKDLHKYARQLILYAYALETLKNKKIKEVGWNMIRYVSKPWRDSIILKERCEVSEFESYPRGILLTDYNEDTKNEMINYIKTTVKNINNKDVNNEYDWRPIHNYRNNFFCKTLCDHYKNNTCIYHK